MPGSPRRNPARAEPDVRGGSSLLRTAAGRRCGRGAGAAERSAGERVLPAPRRDGPATAPDAVAVAAAGDVPGGRGRGAALGRVLHVIEADRPPHRYLALLNENGVGGDGSSTCGNRVPTARSPAFPLLLDELLDERLFEATPTAGRVRAGPTRAHGGCGCRRPGATGRPCCGSSQRARCSGSRCRTSRARLPLMKVSDRLTAHCGDHRREALALSGIQSSRARQCLVADRNDASLQDAGLISWAYASRPHRTRLRFRSRPRLPARFGRPIPAHDRPRTVDNGVFFLRLVQRLVHVLTGALGAGPPLRGGHAPATEREGGLLVAEHRRVRGDSSATTRGPGEHRRCCAQRVVPVRPRCASASRRCAATSCAHAVRRDTLREDVRSMRERRRAELSRSRPGHFDLKQDAGGITDIEFLAQYGHCSGPSAMRSFVTYSDNIRQAPRPRFGSTWSRSRP